MKKTLITIVIILILAGGGYFTYTKGLINLDFLKNGGVVTESILKDNQKNNKTTFDGAVDKYEIQFSDKSTQPETNITTTYMCEGRVKIVHEQDSPSLPPRISYLRVSDNAGMAYYGDMGAYIRPEYFSIDRAQIEQGYSFNEENFCKYLKK